MRETEIVARIRRQAAKGFQNKAVIRGIGDDCAVVRPNSKQDLVFTTDFVLEDRHFTLKTHKPAAIGEKALARSLSDLAAMGAQPLFCLVSLAVPAALGSRFVDGFYRGLLRLAEKHDITLAGGDLARFDKVIADVMCCGSVPKSAAVLRSGARPGDRIYVTGSLGGAEHAFEMGRPLLPAPRVAEGIALRKQGIHAAIDLSDGLSIDLARLCQESKVSAELDSALLPIARRATLNHALHGGEDYQLLVTSNKRLRGPVKEIGTIRAGRVGQVFVDGVRIQSKGFDHFT